MAGDFCTKGKIVGGGSGYRKYHLAGTDSFQNSNSVFVRHSSGFGYFLHSTFVEMIDGDIKRASINNFGNGGKGNGVPPARQVGVDFTVCIADRSGNPGFVNYSNPLIVS